GVVGVVHGLNGTASQFDVADSSCLFCANLIVGRFNQSDVFRVGGGGDVHASGYFVGGADFAEAVSAVGPRHLYAPVDVLVIGESFSRHVVKSARPYSTLVAGIYSTKPGIVASPRNMGDVVPSDVPLAVIGIVPCKVTARNGAIARGDLLVTSDLAGHA